MLFMTTFTLQRCYLQLLAHNSWHVLSKCWARLWGFSVPGSIPSLMGLHSHTRVIPHKHVKNPFHKLHITIPWDFCRSKLANRVHFSRISTEFSCQHPFSVCVFSPLWKCAAGVIVSLVFAVTSGGKRGLTRRCTGVRNPCVDNCLDLDLPSADRLKNQEESHTCCSLPDTDTHTSEVCADEETLHSSPAYSSEVLAYDYES